MVTKRPALVLVSQNDRETVRRAARGGIIGHLRRGAYVRESAELAQAPSWKRDAALLLPRCEAVASTLTCTFAFSHATAAGIHGWDGPASPRLHIVQRTRPGGGKSRDIIRHFAPDLQDSDIVMIDGLPVVTPEVAAVQCALAYEPETALAWVDSGLRKEARVVRFDREASIERQDALRTAWLESLAARGPVRHARRAREVLFYANGLAEFPRESWLRWVALASGLPVPELQVPIQTPGTILYPDMMWPDASPLMVEYDGMDKYDDVGAAVVAQTDREQALIDTTHGRVVRFTRHDKRDRAAAFRRIYRAFETPPPLTPRPLLLARPVRRFRASSPG